MEIKLERKLKFWGFICSFACMEELVWMILVPLSLMWLLWRKWNLRTCEDLEASEVNGNYYVKGAADVKEE
ncbi:hypothetical protein ACB092_09G111400 [Castanea dentata]